MLKQLLVKWYILAIAICCTGVFITSCSDDDESIPVTEVSLNESELIVTEGQKQTLTATITPENATNKNVTWKSNNENVATVSETGEVTAVFQGTATITVTSADGNKTATCDVTVEASKQYTVKFNTNGGSEIEDVIVNEGEILVPPADPTMTGGNTDEGLYLGTINPENKATFNGWFTDEQLTNTYDFNSPVTNDLILYAKWDSTAPEPIDLSEITGDNILEKTFIYVKNIALASNRYTLVVSSDITQNNTLGDFDNNITLTIVGKDQECIIQKTNVGNLFVIKDGTLILGDNIKITGTELGKYRPFFLTGTGNLVMKKGSKISDVTGVTGNTGAIYMDSGTASFTMEGGEICNNIVQATESDFDFMGAAVCAFRGKIYIQGGLIANNKITTNSASYEISGGIYLTNGWNTEFHKTGGVIKDNTAQSEGTGTGQIGQQVLWNGGTNGWKKIDANLGETDNPNTDNMDGPFWLTVQ